MTALRLALASAVTALLIVAGGVVAVRTTAAPRTLAFIAGGRSASAAPAAAVVAPASLGPRALPLSTPTSLDAALATLAAQNNPELQTFIDECKRGGEHRAAGGLDPEFHRSIGAGGNGGCLAHLHQRPAGGCVRP